MNNQENNEIAISRDKISLRFGEMEPVLIPRARLRTRLQLVEWIYRLTGWPGMNLRRMRAFIAAVFQHHGWALPEEKDDPLTTPKRAIEAETLLPDIVHA
jgi:hypothetical protein